MFSFPDAARAIGAELVLANPSRAIHGGSIDTRVLVPNDLFVALRGSRDDGHLHLKEAFEKYASGALVERRFFDPRRDLFLQAPDFYQNFLLVSDSAAALTELARWVRARFSLPVVGITGSVGKTTTKEFLHFILKQKYPVLANAGNFNNHLGLPLTLLRLSEAERFCVAELGASHVGEIRALTRILNPTAGIITAIGPVHLEGFGTLEKIYEAKLELAEVLPSGAPLVLPDDDALLFQKAGRFPVHRIRVGESQDADYRISNIRVQDSFVHFDLNEKRHYAFPGIAGFLARNAGLAIAAAEAVGLTPKDIPDVWEGATLPAGRFQEQIVGDVRFIYDGYNASPASFEKALTAFSELKHQGRKILVFADMLELGSEEKKCHEALGQKIARAHLDFVAAYGERSRTSVEVLRRESPDLNVKFFSEPEQVVLFLKNWIRPGDTLLLKASRGMKIERVLDGFRELQAAL